jgi:hypothetical protein
VELWHDLWLEGNWFGAVYFIIEVFCTETSFWNFHKTLLIYKGLM